MSSNCEHNDLLLMRNGTSQSQRFIETLDPASVKLHDLTTEDWMRFAIQFSRKVNYFDTETNTVSGDWNDFFINEDEIKAFVDKLKNLEEPKEDNNLQKNIEPHLTLFAAFLKLTSFSQERLNALSKKHLDFYYKQVLKLDNKAPVEDKVHILFELAKKATEVKIDESTALDGGKDSNGQKRIYKTQDEIVVNKATVASLRSVFNEQEIKKEGDTEIIEPIGIRNSFVANSFDGLGEGFPDDEIRWWPFGYPKDTPGATQDTGAYPNLPFAKTGFGISSSVLLLKEGNRTITFTIKLSSFDASKLDVTDLPDSIAVLFSGEKEWIEGEIIIEGTNASSITSEELVLVIKINEGADPIVNYDEEVLLEPYNTIDPVVRFVVKNKDINADNLQNKGGIFQELFSKTTVSDIIINVSVDSIQDIVIESDLGALDPSKPFYPFGPQPVKGGNFFIGVPEALDKNWTKVSVDFTWKDKPDNFAEKYQAYKREFRDILSKSIYTLTVDVNGDVQGETDLTSIVEGEDYFKAAVQILEDGEWKPKVTGHELFSGGTIEITKDLDTDTSSKDEVDVFFSQKKLSQKEGTIIFRKDGKKIQTKPVPKEKFSAAAKKGFIKLILNESFLHEMFPRIFSVALSITDIFNASDPPLIPNNPYSPQVETIQVGYDAQASITANNAKLFHEHPFGISEESKELKESSVLGSADDTTIRLLPVYKNGSLYIALENAENLQNVSLLVQTLEGSENPETTNDFAEGEKLKWSILCNNEWLSLNDDYIITNNTDNFLKSGIVKFSIPKQATKDNTKLPSGFHWLKVDNPRDFDTVSQLIDIKAQAVLAQFENNNEDLSHLQYGIPAGTISKLVERLANVKGAAQEYGSFEGKPKETDPEFYRRISERLRHKQRAITIWDYEQLVLQEFPDIYKVNCLNHTSLTSFLSPGNVTLVVIPNTINQNVYDPYKPRISKTKRNDIQNFINQLNTLHVTTQVINPVYEEVKVILKAKFYEGKDENFYKTQLKKDIAKLLAPWAFEETTSIDFGTTLHESSVIDYIEKLEYVDYVTDFELKQEDGVQENGEKKFKKVKKVVPSSAKVILTSVKFTSHSIGEVTPEQECKTVVSV
ncbi:baseplate J/gp47 family protein [uncultured Aquimarina sp.]|uniref:baseplate J/gp47 family protein n=1 Tax=uncultured Aquimarina sp. TaxID=575652 RepID=UPI002602A958|nr:baseplate J/gp47 family protein [uncultured Aquimarina sp.]